MKEFTWLSQFLASYIRSWESKYDTIVKTERWYLKDSRVSIIIAAFFYPKFLPLVSSIHFNRINRWFHNSPLQLTLIGHVIVWFLMRYAFSDVRLGLFRNVPSSFFHTYVIADCSYDTKEEGRRLRQTVQRKCCSINFKKRILVIFTYCSRSRMNTVGHRKGRYWVYPGRIGWDDA